MLTAMKRALQDLEEESERRKTLAPDSLEWEESKLRMDRLLDAYLKSTGREA
jgi:hypothetical protein